MVPHTFCPRCGQKLADGGLTCSHCKVTIQSTDLRSTDAAVLGYLLPVSTSWWAILAGYLGLACPILTFVVVFATRGLNETSLPWVAFVPPVCAILVGLIALGRLRKQRGLRGHMRAWLAILVGALVVGSLVYLQSF